VADRAQRALRGRAGAPARTRPRLPLRLLAQGHRRRARAPGPAARAPWRTRLPRHLPRRPAWQARARLALRHAEVRGRGAGRAPLDRPPPRRSKPGRGPRGRRFRAAPCRWPLGLPARGGGRRCRPGRERRGARRGPGRQHGTPDPAAARARPADAALPAHAAGARRRRPQALEAERRGGLRHLDALGPARGASCAEALAGWVPAWRALYNSRPQ
jgi:hypothetical protein